MSEVLYEMCPRCLGIGEEVHGHEFHPCSNPICDGGRVVIDEFGVPPLTKAERKRERRAKRDRARARRGTGPQEPDDA